MPAWIGPTLKVVVNPKSHVRRNISIPNTDALTRFRKHIAADHLHRSSIPILALYVMPMVQRNGNARQQQTSSANSIRIVSDRIGRSD